MIVGRGSANRLVYLLYDDEQLADFELEFRYRPPSGGNTGVEIRSQPDLSGKRPFQGYHADQKAHYTDIPDAVTLADIRKQDWNHVRVVARGFEFQMLLNGKLSSEFVDNAKEGRLATGAIGVQIHDKGMQVDFKDVRLKQM